MTLFYYIFVIRIAAGGDSARVLMIF
jgi:hypothetical protein